jgi:Chitobiase/beta-hexosaminidase C-terminal domain
MVDSFVLLAPILLLAVVSLLRFVGCSFHPSAATPAAAPTFDPPPGEYSATQSVTLSDAAPNATILFTTDSSTPTNPPTGTTQTFTGPITVSSSEMIIALATAPGYTDSPLASGLYVIDQPIVLQQLAENNETVNSVTVTTAPFANAVTNQNLIVVWLWYNSVAQTVASVTDTGGNAYQRAVGPTAGVGTVAGFQQEIWYAKSINGGANFTVTATFTAAGNFEKSISAHEYAGASLTAPIDVVSAAAVAGNPNVSSGVVPTSAAILIFGAAIFSGRGAAGPGFTQESALRNNVTEDKPFVAPGTAEAIFMVVNGANDWVAQMVTLK